MKGILASIREELVRLAETYKSELEIAKLNQEAAEKELAAVVAQSQEANQDKVTLRQLESSAKTYRTQYDSFLQRYAETVQQQSFPVTEARMISAAAVGFKSCSRNEQSSVICCPWRHIARRRYRLAPRVLEPCLPDQQAGRGYTRKDLIALLPLLVTK